LGYLWWTGKKYKRVKAALRESESRFQIITEANPVPIVISRISDGLVLYANAHLGLIFGLSPIPWLVEKHRTFTTTLLTAKYCWICWKKGEDIFAPAGAFANSAVISDSGEIITRTATVNIIRPIYLPIIFKRW
jgi:PAS domain-containing protein